MRATSLPGPKALERIAERDLLVAGARTRGLADDPGVATARRRAAVQRLLEDAVEGPVDPDAIDEATLRAAYDAAGERFRRPERRRSSHLVALVPKDAPPAVDAAARDAVAGLLGRVRAGESLEAVAVDPGPAPADGVEWRAEELPAWSRDDAADERFLEALFEPEAPGVVDRPVRSDFGWHLIRVDAIEEAADVPFDDAVGLLRGEEATRRRAARLADLLGSLRAGATLELDEDGLAAFLGLPPEQLGVVDPSGADR